MSDVSSILSLPYIQASQAQKHVTHNEALRVLDLLVQLVVEDIDATAPPALPSEGDIHALGSGATGDWAGQDGDLAAWIDGVWVFVSPLVGWRAYDKSTGELRFWTGSSWDKPVPDFDNLAGVGVGTASDATNRLAVQSEASLFTHDGAGHQIKVNKALAADTASLLFQTGWSGRAEMGLAGDDDFVVKVSPDGASWTTALSVSANEGNVGIGTAAPAYPLTITANGDGTGSPVAMRLQNYQGLGSAIAATRGLVLSADHDDNSSAVQSFVGIEVDAEETARFGAAGAIQLGRSGQGDRISVDNILSLTPGVVPAQPQQGDIYFDATALVLRCWDGTVWQDLF